MKNPCEEIALKDGQFCTLTPPAPLKFKIGDKVIFRLRSKGKSHVAVITEIGNNRLRYKYLLRIGAMENCLAAELELTPWTELNEALL